MPAKPGAKALGRAWEDHVGDEALRGAVTPLASTGAAGAVTVCSGSPCDGDAATVPGLCVKGLHPLNELPVLSR